MKKLLMVLGLVAFLMVMALPAFSQSLRFDVDGDGEWDSDWGMVPGETVEVDVWLDLYSSDNDVSAVLYGFLWDPASVTVTQAVPYDTENGGPWSTASSYAHLPYSGGYWYRVGGPNVVSGIPVTTKIKLHTIEIHYTGGVSQIETYKVSDFEGVSVTPAGGTELFTLTHVSALIHPPSDCEITIDPDAAAVFTGGSIPFSASVTGEFCHNPCYTWEVLMEAGSTGSSIDANGLYRAGDTPGTEMVTVTDRCNGDVSAAAVVQVSAVTTTTTTVIATTTSIPYQPPATTSSIPAESPCSNDDSCDDGVFCNGAETCDPEAVCRPGSDPCADDGEFCNGDESCDEEADQCVSSGDPCEEDEICIEEGAVCEPAISIGATFSGCGVPFLTWIGIVQIQGTGTGFGLTSVVLYDSPLVLKTPKFLNSRTQTITQVVWLLPSLIFPAWDYPATVTVSVDTLSDTIEIPACF